MANCDNCGAPLRLDPGSGLLVCDHCGAQREGPAGSEGLELLDETSSMCPICSTPLSNGRLEGHPLLCCARCYGLLIEMNRFATVIDAMRAREKRGARIALPRRQHPGDRLLSCPRCGQPMVSHLYEGGGNVVIDTCESCSGQLAGSRRAPSHRRCPVFAVLGPIATVPWCLLHPHVRAGDQPQLRRLLSRY